ncbi:Polyamine aminopropyltransferase [subsurface metagenome]
MKDSDPDKHKWFHDYVSPDITISYRVKDLIYSGKTKFQSIAIIDNNSFGKCLVLDGKIQSSEVDEFIYHEALVHPVMITHSHPEKVFIAGGGEGATLREVLAYNSVKKAVMVDIDEEVVDICRRFLFSWHQNSFDDQRVELHFTDARVYLEKNDDKFDVIIIDLPDPLAKGPARLLYTQEFYQLVKQRLQPNGIISVQAESADWTELENFVGIVNTMANVFPIVRPYQAHIPSFNSLWGFASASRKLDPAKLTPEDIDVKISTRISRQLKFYDGLTHQAIFTIPKHLRLKLSETKKVITDKEPISAY